MERHLNLISGTAIQNEKRIFPRFPFCFLTFKGFLGTRNQVFEVRDISFTGMQLALRDGHHGLMVNDTLRGHIHWLGHELPVSSVVKWTTKGRLGVAFEAADGLIEKVRNFLSVPNMVSGLRPLHLPEMGLELPPSLKYWLRADGPIELFVWQHEDGKFGRFQLIMLQNFVEWTDGVGVRTGRTLFNRDIETPLQLEDEFIFQMDREVDQQKILLALDIITEISPKLLPKQMIEFLKTRLT